MILSFFHLSRQFSLFTFLHLQDRNHLLAPLVRLNQVLTIRFLGENFCKRFLINDLDRICILQESWLNCFTMYEMNGFSLSAFKESGTKNHLRILLHSINQSLCRTERSIFLDWVTISYICLLRKKHFRRPLKNRFIKINWWIYDIRERDLGRVA